MIWVTLIAVILILGYLHTFINTLSYIFLQMTALVMVVIVGVVRKVERSLTMLMLTP